MSRCSICLKYNPPFFGINNLGFLTLHIPESTIITVPAEGSDRMCYLESLPGMNIVVSGFTKCCLECSKKVNLFLHFLDIDYPREKWGKVMEKVQAFVDSRKDVFPKEIEEDKDPNSAFHCHAAPDYRPKFLNGERVKPLVTKIFLVVSENPKPRHWTKDYIELPVWQGPCIGNVTLYEFIKKYEQDKDFMWKQIEAEKDILIRTGVARA